MDKLFPIVLTLLCFGCDDSSEERIEDLEAKVADYHPSTNLLKAPRILVADNDGNMISGKQNSNDLYEYYNFSILNNKDLKNIQSEIATVINYDDNTITMELINGFTIQYSSGDYSDYRKTDFETNTIKLGADSPFFKKYPFKD